MRIREASGGWFIEYNHRYVHLTAEWCEQIHHHQYEVHGHQNGSLNKLRYHLAHNTGLTADQVAEWFQDFYGEIKRNSQDRKSLGLKPVTKHGHADLEAVRNGAEVRPWNAARTRDPGFEQFIKEKS
jgi:hypothetical protein